jgi:hypothetical protein
MRSTWSSLLIELAPLSRDFSTGISEEKRTPQTSGFRKYVMLKLPMRLEGDQVIFRGDLRYHKDIRTNFSISTHSTATRGPKVN